MPTIPDFSKTSIRWGRPLSSYTRVQMYYGRFRRQWAPVVNQDRTASLRLLNAGCGPNLKPDFVNLDYWWLPGLDVCCDITKPLPLADRTMEGIFTEHCLEHIPFEACQEVLKDFRRLMKPGGTIRIAVPDAELFVDLYCKAREGQTAIFPYHDDYPDYTPMMHVNRIFRDHGHLFAYDFETMSRLLRAAGFSGIAKAKYRQGRDSRLLIDAEHRACESLYIEASIPTLSQ